MKISSFKKFKNIKLKREKIIIIFSGIILIFTANLIGCKKENTKKLKDIGSKTIQVIQIKEDDRDVDIYYDNNVREYIEKYKEKISRHIILPFNMEIVIDYHLKTSQNDIRMPFNKQLNLQNLVIQITFIDEKSEKHNLLTYSIKRGLIDHKIIGPEFQQVKKWYPNGKLKMYFYEGLFFMEFYENGRIKQYGKLSGYNVKYETWYYYSPDGKIVREIEYDFCKKKIIHDKIYDKKSVEKYFNKEYDFLPYVYVFDRI